MKRALSVILAFILIFSSCVISFAEGECEHNPEQVTAKAESCTEDGNKNYYKCSKCEGLFTDEACTDSTTLDNVTIPATGHNPEPIYAKAPSCTADGCHAYFKCKNCENLFTDEACTQGTTLEAQKIPKLSVSGEHQFIITLKKASTCTEKGSVILKCKVEGCPYEKEMDVEMLPHTLVGTAREEATCLKTGNIEYWVCTECGKYFKQENDEKVEIDESEIEIPIAEHKYSDDFTEDKAPTCTDKGEKSKHCTVEGCTERTEITEIDANGHSMKTVDTVKANCVDKGCIHHYECKNCEYISWDPNGEEPIENAQDFEPPVNPENHKAELTHTGANDASCSTEGNIEYWSCSACGKNFSDAEGKIVAENITVERLAHTYDQQVVEAAYKVSDASCTAKATYYYSCICGEKGTTTFEDGEMLAHSFTNYVSNNDATCLADGTKTAKCDNCVATDTIADTDSKKSHSYTGEYKNDGDKHTRKCENGCNEYGGAEAHSYDTYVSEKTPETCSTNRVDNYKCICGATTEKEIEDTKLTAVFEDGTKETYVWADDYSTCTATIVCKNCDGTTTGHKLTQTVNSTSQPNPAATCTVKGKTTYTATFTENTTYFSTQTETVENLEALGHSFAAENGVQYVATDKHNYKCSRCDEYGVGTTKDATEDCAYGDWSTVQGSTCTAEGSKHRLCSVCNNEDTDVIEKIEHTYTKKVVKDTYMATAATCTAKATYYYSCVCGAKGTDTFESGKALGHTEVIDKAVAATCKKTGLTEGKHCSVCKVVIKAQETIPVKEHTVVTDKAVAPTCTETGLTEGKHCSVCRAVIMPQEYIAATGHTKVTDKAVAPTCTKTGKTAGSHCSVCGKAITAQKTVAAKGHTYKTTLTAATTSKDGKMITKCSVCGYVKSTTTIAKVSTIALAKKSVTYTGAAQKVAVSVKNSNGKALKSGTDYTVTYKNNVTVGTATVTITLKGNYSGKNTLKFSIVKATVKNITLSGTKLAWDKVAKASYYKVKVNNDDKKVTSPSYTFSGKCGEKTIVINAYDKSNKIVATGTKKVTIHFWKTDGQSCQKCEKKDEIISCTSIEFVKPADRNFKVGQKWDLNREMYVTMHCEKHDFTIKTKLSFNSFDTSTKGEHTQYTAINGYPASFTYNVV